MLQFDGVFVVSGSLDTSIRVWDADTGTNVNLGFYRRISEKLHSFFLIGQEKRTRTEIPRVN